MIDWKRVFQPWYDYYAASQLNLPQQLFDRWVKDPNKRLYCIFCGGDSYSPQSCTHHAEGHTILACPKCREYKGLQPYIEGYNA